MRQWNFDTWYQFEHEFDEDKNEDEDTDIFYVDGDNNNLEEATEGNETASHKGLGCYWKNDGFYEGMVEMKHRALSETRTSENKKFFMIYLRVYHPFLKGN